MRRFTVFSILTPLLYSLLAGCAGSSGPIDPYVQKLQWLDAADPQADANQAVKQNARVAEKDIPAVFQYMPFPQPGPEGRFQEARFGRQDRRDTVAP